MFRLKFQPFLGVNLTTVETVKRKLPHDLWAAETHFPFLSFLGRKKHPTSHQEFHQEFSSCEILSDNHDFWLCMRIWALNAGSQLPQAMQVWVGRLDALLPALCSLLSPQKFRDHLTSTRLWLIWLLVVHKEWSSLSFSLINFARNDFHSSEFGLWRCYRLCARLFPMLARGVASDSEWLSESWKYM